MQRLLVFATSVLGATCFLSVSAAALTEERIVDPPRTLTVTGRGEVSASPDLAIIAVAVETTAATASAAVAENANRSAAVAAALKEKLGKDDRLTTTGYSLDPRYEDPKPGTSSSPKIVGYVAHNEVQAETHQIDAVGALIDSATAAGANRVSSLQFTLANRNDQLRAALEKAGAEARAQAETIARALGVALKSVQRASTEAEPIVHPRYMSRGMAAMEARAPTPIEPGSVSVSATLAVTYAIE